MIEYLLAREGTKLNYQNIMKISFNGLCLYGQVMNQVCFIKKERKGENKKFSIAFERLNVCLIECDTWIMSKAKNGRFSIHPKIIQGETSFVFIVETTIFLSSTKYFLLLSLKNQFSSHEWNIFFFCLWKCIPSNALLTLNEKMQRTAHAEKIIRLKLNLIKSFAREMQPCLIAKGKNIHLWRKSNVKKDNRNRCNPVEIWLVF